MPEYVVLVDERDREVRPEEKLAAHLRPHLHRAFSVFLFDSRGAMLLQRRAQGKYHSSGLWSNACCGHPRPGEEPGPAAGRRVREELGVDCTLSPAGCVTYSLVVSEGLYEHEFNHVFAGILDSEPRPNASEVSDVRWIEATDLRTMLTETLAALTPWFPLVLAQLRRFALEPSAGHSSFPLHSRWLEWDHIPFSSVRKES